MIALRRVRVGAAYFTGPDFAENPIGILFDPEQLIRGYEAGRSVEGLVRRPPLPPGKTPMAPDHAPTSR